MENFECVIVGGGIVGLAIGAQLSKKMSVVLIEKDEHLLSSTSSRNSEVIHAGIYYDRDSLKRSLCIDGKNRLYEYCQEKGVPYKKIGKLIISNSDKPDQINKLHQKGIQNGVDDLVLLEESVIKNYEPDINAKFAIFSPSSGIIDTHSYGESLANDIESNDGLILRKTKFLSAELYNDKTKVNILNPDNSDYSFTTNFFINSSGHDALSIEKSLSFGIDSSEIESFAVKGNYFSYTGKNPFKHLIYPMPDELGLGIHSTSNIANELKFGPDVDLTSQDYMVNENKKEFFYDLIKIWWSDVEWDRLNPSYVGLRPKIKINSEVYKDFLININSVGSSKYISLLGIESPGITASLGIAAYCERLLNIE